MTRGSILRNLLATLQPAWLVIGCLILVGCAVKSQDIQKWKTTVKGPGKLAAVVGADKYSTELRAEAALALVELNRADVDGVAELLRAFRRIEPEDKRAIIARMVPDLEERLTQGEVKLGEEPDVDEVRAKDAAFILLPHTDEETRKTLSQALITWYAKDINGRSLSGSASSDQVIRAIGPPAAPVLLEAMNQEMPPEVLVKVAEAIAAVGSGEQKQQAAKHLLEIEKSVREPAYVSWLEQEIVKQLSEDQKQQKLDESRLRRAAIYNQQIRIVNGVLVAMKHLGSEPAVAERLVTIASTTDKAYSTEEKAAALQALEGHVERKHQDAMLSLALDESKPAQLRDLAFDRLGEVATEGVLPRMWPLFASSADEKLRWHVGELILSVGGPESLTRFFRTLSPASSYSPEELDGYAARISQMKPLPVATMQQHLSDASWPAQIVSLRFFERHGPKADLAAIAALTGVTTPVRGQGWEEGATVGSEASQAKAVLEANAKQ